MRTVSILLQTLCVPCACRCRHCLLSWSGKPVGVSWERGQAFALRFKEWQETHSPELSFHFSFGYSMEHPQLREALRFLRRIGSPEAEYLQCDGLAMRGEAQCAAFSEMLVEEGVKHLNFTFFGLSEYHDRFAGRQGDFDLLLRMIRAAQKTGLTVSAGIALNAENAAQADALAALLRQAGCETIRLSVPHGEGRGAALEAVRLTEQAFQRLSAETQALLNRMLYRPEREWLSPGSFTEETKRSLLISLRTDNIERYASMDFAALVSEIEALDDAYYAAFPTLPELAERYGNSSGDRFFRQRDLYHHYRRLCAKEFGIAVYDVTDERQSGSRRF